MLNALKKKTKTKIHTHNGIMLDKKNESDKNNVSACETESFIV